jgi:hypothetical protein
MKALEPLAWIVGLTTFIVLLFWIGSRLMRWARTRSKATDLLGLGMALPAAGVNPQPPPRIKIEEVARDIQGRKNSDTADPDKPKVPD